MKLKERIITEKENYFSIKFRESEMIFEFDDSHERLDQYQNAIDFLTKLNKDNKTD
jgi:hypothetical protein